MASTPRQNRKSPPRPSVQDLENANRHGYPVTLKLPRAVYRRAREAADREGITLRQWIRNAVIAELDVDRHHAALRRGA